MGVTSCTDRPGADLYLYQMQGVTFHTIAASEPLAGYVRAFWVLEGEVAEDRPYIHRTLATFSPELIFHYKRPFEELTPGNRQEKTFLTGIHAQTGRIRRFVVKEEFGIFGVFLEPYAIPALFGIPSAAIANELPDLFALLGQEGKDLEEQMMFAANTAARIELVTSFLQRRLSVLPRPEIIHATRIIYERKGQLNLRRLADDCCLSQRQFERKFKETIGFTPKTFSRIVRFRSLVAGNRKHYHSLAEMAYDFGYCDQAHFIDDFKEFSGYTPHAYFSGKAEEVFYAPH